MTEIKQLLRITERLREKYDEKLDFPLDGRLVGDIGEALVSEKFDIELYGKNAQVYDGIQRRTNKRVQIKSSLKYNFSYPFNKDLDYYIAVHIESGGGLEIIYNGPGKIVHDFIKERKRKTYKDIWYTVAASHLRMLNEMVKEEDRIHPVNR